MKRSPFVVGGTLAGLLGVVMFHTSSVPFSFAVGTTTIPVVTSPSTTAPTPVTTSPPTTVTVRRHHRASAVTTTPSTTPPTVASTTTSTAVVASGTRRATGPLVDYYFGQLSVTVTATGSTVTAVKIGTLNDSDYRSQSIDQYSIPILVQETLAAQSANIQSVSGASYTSAGFAQSLQGALAKLGI